MSSLLEHKRKKYIEAVRKRNAAELQSHKDTLADLKNDADEVLMVMGLQNKVADAMNEYAEISTEDIRVTAIISSEVLLFALKQCIVYLRQADDESAEITIKHIKNELESL